MRITNKMTSINFDMSYTHSELLNHVHDEEFKAAQEEEMNEILEEACRDVLSNIKNALNDKDFWVAKIQEARKDRLSSGQCNIKLSKNYPITENFVKPFLIFLAKIKVNMPYGFSFYYDNLGYKLYTTGTLSDRLGMRIFCTTGL